MKKRGFLQISFPWMFAIIVGIAILFFTIYGLTKLIGTEETIQDVKTSKELGILLNPLETGFEEAKSSSLTFPVETRVHNLCTDFGDFGKQTIRISQKGLKNEWTMTTVDVNFENKYIFSSDPVQGRTVNLFSKPFDYPFKVSDLIYMTSSSDVYCFKDAPGDIEDEIENLNQNNLIVENCSSDDHIIVCFSGGGAVCDMEVSYVGKTVEKRGETMYFETDALMYGAIFSDKSVYECQLKRLIQRINSLAEIYQDKLNFLRDRGCTTTIDLPSLINLDIADSSDLSRINDMVQSVDTTNKGNVQCKLW